jgi:hypothetical protein
MNTRMETKQTGAVQGDVAYEPPTLIKQGSLSELTLMAMKMSGSGCDPWGKKTY